MSAADFNPHPEAPAKTASKDGAKRCILRPSFEENAVRLHLTMRFAHD